MSLVTGKLSDLKVYFNRGSFAKPIWIPFAQRKPGPMDTEEPLCQCIVCRKERGLKPMNNPDLPHGLDCGCDYCLQQRLDASDPGPPAEALEGGGENMAQAIQLDGPPPKKPHPLDPEKIKKTMDLAKPDEVSKPVVLQVCCPICRTMMEVTDCPGSVPKIKGVTIDDKLEPVEDPQPAFTQADQDQQAEEANLKPFESELTRIRDVVAWLSNAKAWELQMVAQQLSNNRLFINFQIGPIEEE